jgi:hypothetical protein
MMMITGAIALFAPAITGVTVTLFFRWLLIISGILRLGYAWRASGAGAAIWEIPVAIVYGAAGFYLLARPVQGLEALAVALVAYLVLESALEFVLALSLRPLPGSGWLVFDGIITLLLGVLDLGDRHAGGDQHVLQWLDAADGLGRRAERGGAGRRGGPPSAALPTPRRIGHMRDDVPPFVSWACDSDDLSAGQIKSFGPLLDERLPVIRRVRLDGRWWSSTLAA